MAILVVDVGTTHCKAGLFAEDGASLRVATRATPRSRDRSGAAIIAPEALWEAVAAAIAEVLAERPAVAAVGVAGMAETGLLLGRRDGRCRTPLLPWFDEAAAPSAARLAGQADPAERFAALGIYPSFKVSLAKILRAAEPDRTILDGAVWLGAPEYIAHRLSAAHGTDPSLAGRTYAFDLRARAWDGAWLRQLGLPPDLFPQVVPSGAPLGHTGRELAALGLAPGTPVAVCGHDHICAAVAAGATEPGRAFDSMGTAEALIGALEAAPEPRAAMASGLTFGLLPLGERWYWLGGLSSAGGSLDWLRGLLGDPPLSYAQLHALQEALDPAPGEILYLPYLAGSGAPLPNPAARGAFIGLAAAHTRADMLRAVLEGTAYQLEAIRRAAAGLTGRPPRSITVAGGGARNRRWLQIKADIYGAPLDILADDEATLLGAALVAGAGCGVYAHPAEALAVAARRPSTRLAPDAGRHQIYAERFDRGFAPWQRQLSHPKEGITSWLAAHDLPTC
jgi:xylulokinase